MENPLGIDGFYFVEFSSLEPEILHIMCNGLGLNKHGLSKSQKITWYKKNDINFFVNEDKTTHSHIFTKLHGPSASSMAFKVKDANEALGFLEKKGAEVYQKANKFINAPAIIGIGGSLIYLIDDEIIENLKKDFTFLNSHTEDNGLDFIDHLTHNVYIGKMNKWADFYINLFNFKEIRYFDIKGQKTGLISKALRSPCGKIRIPLNESRDDKSQIAEYLKEYNGEGIQHIALHSNNIYQSVEKLKNNGIKFLHTPNTYYELVNKRLPGHEENLEIMKKLKILIDGETDKPNKPLLLQIFTQNMIGPIFFELIQRKGHEGFGEGNFQALFEAIELDQIRRGVL